MARKSIPLKTKLAAALVEMYWYEFPLDHLKAMTEDQFLSLFQWDHAVAVAHEGTDQFWNLSPLLISDHRMKTAKVDIPRIAKSKRIDKKWSDFMRATASGKKPPRRKSRWPKRKFRT